MSDLLPLKDHITYGPVNSRRLGRSLGINLLPPAHKSCTFDCLYCHYGWTPTGADVLDSSQKLPRIEAVAQAVETALQRLSEPPAYLTFSGNGEPTLHPDFPKIVEAIVLLRDRLAPKAKTAILSNATRVDRSEVRAALLRLDRPILKLDAGNDSVFRVFNRPLPGVDYEEVVRGLAEMRKMSLQAMFAGGPEGNTTREHVDQWIEKVKSIGPQDVQIYSLSRPVPSRSITPAPSSLLNDIRSRLVREGIPTEHF